MLSDYDLQLLNKLSKDSTIAAAYAILPQIRELILSLGNTDKEFYDKLYQLAHGSLRRDLDEYGIILYPNISESKPVSHFMLFRGIVSAKILKPHASINAYKDFFSEILGEFFYVNVGAFAPYLKKKNKDGSDAARMVDWWENIEIDDENLAHDYMEWSEFFFETWKLDWGKFRETMIHDENKSKRFLKELEKPIALFGASIDEIHFENSRFTINDKVYLVFTYS